jgi:cleavage and polyadenylation specificity factor subunit 1
MAGYMCCNSIQTVSEFSFPLEAQAIEYLSSLITSTTDPKSLQGHLLLHRTTFATGPNYVTSTLMLPRTLASGPSRGEDEGNSPHILLLASPSGQIAALTPLSESAYRRLVSVSTQLLNALPDHTAGLNPKSFRQPANPTVAGVDAGIGRAIVDGTLLARWNELGAVRRWEIAGKGGYAAVDQVRAELDAILGWNGLAYF